MEKATPEELEYLINRLKESLSMPDSRRSSLLHTYSPDKSHKNISSNQCPFEKQELSQ
jgi:hypothetical protein